MTTWFETDARHNFERFLPDALPSGQRDYVQIGVWAGDASRWLLEHALRPGDVLWDVDPFLGTPGEHGAAEASVAYARYQAMLEEQDLSRVTVRTSRNTSDRFLAQVSIGGMLRNQVAFAYVDGDHSLVQVAKDVEGIWPLMRSGGIMACDDFQWQAPGRMHDRPRPALLAFLERHQGEYDVLVDDYQLWLRKKG